LSSFGILFNREMCERRDIAPPTSWADLAAPRFYGWIGLANPAQSGSNQRCLQIILQKHGWDAGWAIILRMLANARGLVDRSSDAVEQVQSGIFLASCAINFQGERAAALGGEAIAYLNPREASAVSPDVISVLKCAPEPELAERFVRFCLSEEGQKLWGVRAAGSDSNHYTLFHYPIDPRIYTRFADRLALNENPLETNFGLVLDLKDAEPRDALLVAVVNAACGENHVLLQRAWQALIQAGLPVEALAELTAPPFEQEAAEKHGRRLVSAGRTAAADLQREWSSAFKNRYEKVLQKAGAQAAAR
ncbi:MAG: extracellular solute-binding protein, partial [Phycisphaerae bacterium]